MRAFGALAEERALGEDHGEPPGLGGHDVTMCWTHAQSPYPFGGHAAECCGRIGRRPTPRRPTSPARTADSR